MFGKVCVRLDTSYTIKHAVGQYKWEQIECAPSSWKESMEQEDLMRYGTMYVKSYWLDFTRMLMLCAFPNLNIWPQYVGGGSDLSLYST